MKRVQASFRGRWHTRTLRFRLTSVGLLWISLAWGLAQAGAYDVRNGTVAGGGAIASAGPYRVISTVAEPVMGTTSAGAYRITAGFPATLANTLPPSGTIFVDGFE